MHAEKSASNAMLLSARTLQAVADGQQPKDILDHIKPEVQSHGNLAARLRLLSFCLIIVGSAFFILSLLYREPTKQQWAMPFLAIAVLIQFILV